MRAVWLGVFVLVTSGCVGPLSGEDPPASSTCPSAKGFWAPAGNEVGEFQTDGVQRSDLVAFFPHTKNIRITGVDHPQRWKWEVENLGPMDDNGTFIRFGLTGVPITGPSGGARDPSQLSRNTRPVMINWTAVAPEDCAASNDTNSWRIGPRAAGKTVQPGDGVAVLYAGFWLNGTLFSTNMASVDSSDWPRGGWYTGGENKPLNVFVYDRDRSERTAQWAPTDPQGKPVAWSYSTTIKGFNQALKGMSEGSTRVVVVPKEDAYGASPTHTLRDDTLVFLIDVVEIVDVPCPPEVAYRPACRMPA